MKKTILWSATFLSLFALAACSNSKSSENQTKKENTSSSKVTSSSKTSNSKNSAWVKEESQKLLDSSQTLAIPTSFDEQAAQIISKIEIK